MSLSWPRLFHGAGLNDYISISGGVYELILCTLSGCSYCGTRSHLDPYMMLKAAEALMY